jgi:hypothetical protein
VKKNISYIENFETLVILEQWLNYKIDSNKVNFLTTQKRGFALRLSLISNIGVEICSQSLIVIGLCEFLRCISIIIDE